MELDEPLQEIIQIYESFMRSIDEEARNTEDRAYGGVVRMEKGKLFEQITECIVNIAWQHAGGNSDSLEINSKKIPIPIRSEYISRIRDPKVKQHIQQNIANYVYRLSVDKHIFINGNFVIGIECKAYAENAMIKRILIDFDFLKKQYPDLSCYLFQFESHLGGDYSDLTKPVYGSLSTHTIQSYFECDLNIITLLEGERKIDFPIHKYFKPLKIEVLRDVINLLAADLKRFL